MTEALLDLFFRVVMLVGLIGVVMWCWFLRNTVAEQSRELTSMAFTINDHDEDLNGIRHQLSTCCPHQTQKNTAGL